MHLSLPPENIKNFTGFFMFLGGRKRVHWKQMAKKIVEEIQKMYVNFQLAKHTYTEVMYLSQFNKASKIFKTI